MSKFDELYENVLLEKDTYEGLLAARQRLLTQIEDLDNAYHADKAESEKMSYRDAQEFMKRRRMVRQKQRAALGKQVEKYNIKLEKLAYDVEGAKKVFRSLKLGAAKFASTAIRGYQRLDTAGYRINNYDPSTIDILEFRLKHLRISLKLSKRMESL
jgi:hypothetical protein